MRKRGEGAQRSEVPWLMDVQAIASMPLEDLQEVVRPAGFYRQKASRIQNLARHIVRHHSADPGRMLEKDAGECRVELLSLPGIGDETADAILLFAGRKPKFIVAAYVRRLLDRLGMIYRYYGRCSVHGRGCHWTLNCTCASMPLVHHAARLSRRPRCQTVASDLDAASPR